MNDPFCTSKNRRNKEKGRNSIQVFQENKALQIFSAYQGVRNVRFPENLACLFS